MTNWFSTSTPKPRNGSPTPPQNRWERLKSIGALVGVESIRRTNKTIDEMDARTKLANHRLLYGDRGELPEGFDDMGGDLVGGDQVHQHNYPPSPLTQLIKGATLVAFAGGSLWALPSIIDAFKSKEEPIEEPPVITVPEGPAPSVGFLGLGEPD